MSKTLKMTPTLTKEQRKAKAAWQARRASEQRALEALEREQLTGTYARGRGW